MGHTARTIAEGTNFMAFLESGTTTKTYKPFASQTSCTLNDDSDELESTSKNVGNYANYQYGRERWSASLDMFNAIDTNTAEVNYSDIVLMRKKREKPTILFAYVDEDGEIDTTKNAFRGKVLLKLPKTADDGSLEKVTVSMKGCLELEYLQYADTAWEKVPLT